MGAVTADHARHRARRGRRVHDHVGEAAGAEGGERLVRVLREPRAMAELHGQRAARQPRREARRGRRGAPGRSAPTARTGRARSRACRPRPAAGRRPGTARRPRRAPRRAGSPASTSPRGVSRGAAGRSARISAGSASSRVAVAGHGREGLDVEDEARRGALHPARGGADVGNGVVGGVDLHHVEDARVEAQAGLGGHRLPGIERPVLDERGIRPRADPDPDVTSRAGAQTIFS